jgi:hypothetical protein
VVQQGIARAAGDICKSEGQRPGLDSPRNVKKGAIVAGLTRGCVRGSAVQGDGAVDEEPTLLVRNAREKDA